MHCGVKVSTAGGVNRIVLPAVSVKLYKNEQRKNMPEQLEPVFICPQKNMRALKTACYNINTGRK